IPDNLVWLHGFFKTAAVSTVDGGFLYIVGIVYHAVFSVFRISVYVNIVIGAEPAEQCLLIGRAPEDRAVEDPAVFKAVRKSADINGAAFSESVDRHLHFFVSLDEDLGMFQCVDVLFSLSKVNVTGHILKDKVRVFLPVVLVIAERKAVFFLHAEDIGKLEEMSLVLVAGRLSHADDSAAF